MKTHEVKQGEHLTRIAARYGVIDADSLWNHPVNAELRRLRHNPDVLLPGDVVVIPDGKGKSIARPTGARHRFLIPRGRLMLRLVFLDLQREPIAGANVSLVLGGESQGMTGPDGRFERELDPADEHGEVTLAYGSAWLRVGHLDPIEEESGVRARLSNLGYFIGDVEDADDVEELRLALQEFQADYELPFSGEIDDTTRAKLLEVHGC